MIQARFSTIILPLCPEARFAMPATSAEVQEVETTLGVALPEDLRRALEESNGISGQYQLPLLWPCQEIISRNTMFRTHRDFSDLYMPFDHLLFFADAGNGDLFAYSITRSGKIENNAIFVWDHETDGRSLVSHSLATYFERWLSGELKL